MVGHDQSSILRSWNTRCNGSIGFGKTQKTKSARKPRSRHKQAPLIAASIQKVPLARLPDQKQPLSHCSANAAKSKAVAKPPSIVRVPASVVAKGHNEHDASFAKKAFASAFHFFASSAVGAIRPGVLSSEHSAFTVQAKVLQSPVRSHILSELSPNSHFARSLCTNAAKHLSVHIGSKS